VGCLGFGGAVVGGGGLADRRLIIPEIPDKKLRTHIQDMQPDPPNIAPEKKMSVRLKLWKTCPKLRQTRQRQPSNSCPRIWQHEAN
jgi:hypothetical protein